MFKKKLKKNGKINNYKARSVAKRLKVTSNSTVSITKKVFALVARDDAIKLIIDLATQNSWLIFQLDMKSAFLHDLQE